LDPLVADAERAPSGLGLLIPRSLCGMMDVKYLHFTIRDAIENLVWIASERHCATPGRFVERRELSGQRAMCATTLRMRRSTTGATAG
jgi:hypothetical protein